MKGNQSATQLSVEQPWLRESDSLFQQSHNPGSVDRSIQLQAIQWRGLEFNVVGSVQWNSGLLNLTSLVGNILQSRRGQGCSTDNFVAD